MAWLLFGLELAQAQWLPSEARLRDRTSRTSALLRADSSGFAVIRFSKANDYGEVETYNTRMKYQQTYAMTDMERKYIGVIKLQQQGFLVYFRYKLNRQNDKYESVSLYAKPINPETYRVEPDSIELIAPFAMNSNYYQGNFAVSPDRKKVLIYDYEEEGDVEGVSGLTNKLRLRVFNAELEKLWEREIDLAPEGTLQRIVVIKKVKLSNEGEVAVLTDVFRSGDTRSYASKVPTTDPTLFFVGEKPEHFMRFTPNWGRDLFYNQMDFHYDKQGNIVWFGFYSKQKYYWQGGYFFIKVNAERSRVLSKVQSPFAPELLAELSGKKRYKPGLEAQQYKLCHWYLSQDGGLVLSAERQPPGLRRRTHDLLLMRLDSAGQLRWAKHHYKYADYSEDLSAFSSHFMFLDQDNMYVLYNRGIYSGDVAVILRFDPTGEMARRTLFDYDKQPELLCPDLTYLLGDGRLFICLQSRFFKYYGFGVLDLRRFWEEAGGG